jgi:hypothetical protein
MMLFPCFDCGGQISLSEQQIQEIIKKVGEKLPAPSYMLTCPCKRSEWALEVKVVRKHAAGET